jgi:PKD repeat protein
LFTATTTGAAASSFIWDFGDGQTATTTTNQTNHVYTNTTNNNQTFTVSVKAVSSCNGTISAAATTDVIVKPQPNASISPGGLTQLCPGDPLPLVTTISNTSSGNFSYQWYQNGVLIPGANGLTYNINSVGSYYAVVTNTATGCTTTTNVRTVALSPNCNSNCTPVGPAGISNFDVELIGCGMIQATCNTAGTIGGNIISFQWELVAPGTNPVVSGTETINSSHIFTINKPGEYQVKLHVTYQNSDPNGNPCVITAFGNIIVPVIANFKWGMACVGNNGYTVTLTDNSAVYGNMSVSSRQWKINNMVQANVSPSFGYTVPSNLLGTNLTVDITVDNGSGFPCTATQTISVPNLPVADFTTVTTNNTFPTSRSCEGRAVVFTNTSSPMATILSNIWDFGDQTTFHGVSPIKEYKFSLVNQSSNLPIVTLTITDKYNCTSVKSTNLTIDKNDLSAQSLSNSFYTINPTTPPCYAPGQTVNVAVNIGGGSPNAFEWYKEADQITAPSLANINVNSQGAYWVKMYNDKFCYKAVNPKPAAVSFRYPTQAIITGKQDACINTPFVLKAPKATGLTYSWVRNPGNVVCGATQTITENRPVGVYTYTLTLTQTGGCSSTSAPYTVTVHNLPQAPSIAENVVDCDSYQIDLTASSPIASSFTWSTGQNSASIQVAHGGPYRAWLTDQFGCENYAEIDVPLAPNTYFWRFPTGCYTFCPGELPKWVDGPSHVRFKYWEWLISREGNTEIADPNNNMGGSGSSSTCAPLWIDFPPLGSGSGDYQWGLNTGLCYQRSGIMSVNLLEKCCEIEIKDIKIECKDGLYSFVLNVNNNSNCPDAYYNLYLLDANTLQPIGSFSSLSPSTLVPGGNTIGGVFITPNPVTSTTNVIFKIEVFCNDKEHCIGTIKAEIPICKGKQEKAMDMTNKKTEPGYITALNIAPNPANATLNIGYRFMDENPAIKRNIQIYDVVGRPVENIMIYNSTGTYALDVSKYAQGVYFVEMRENNQHLLIKRIVIKH